MRDKKIKVYCIALDIFWQGDFVSRTTVNNKKPGRQSIITHINGAMPVADPNNMWPKATNVL